jgi:hypothetical protein
LDQYDCDDVCTGNPVRVEASAFHPGDDIVKTPGDVKTDSTGREVPSVDRRFVKDEESMWNSEN